MAKADIGLSRPGAGGEEQSMKAATTTTSLVAWAVTAASLLGASAGRPPLSAVPANLPKEWTIPAVRIRPTAFWVTADCQYIIYAEMPRPTGKELPPSEYWVMSAATSKRTRLADLLPKALGGGGAEIMHVLPAPAGHWVCALVKRGTDEQAACVVDLQTGKTWQPKIEPVGPVAWAGQDLAITVIREGAFRPICFATPFTDKKADLKAHGMLLGAASQAKALLVMGDPANLGKPMDAEGLAESGEVLLIGPDGKVLCRAAHPKELGEMPMASPKGQFVAFQRQPPEEGKPFTVRVVSIATGQKRDIEGLALPVAVLDDGQVICQKAVFGAGGQPLTLHDPKGGTRTLVDRAENACLVGDRLFYIVPPKDKATETLSKVRWVRLQPPTIPKPPGEP